MSNFTVELGGARKSVEDVVRDLKIKREKQGRDISLPSYLKEFGMTMPQFMYQVDKSGAFDTVVGGLDGLTIGKFLSLDDKTRWLVPEIFLEAVREGILGAPVYNALIRAETKIDGLNATIPTIDRSKAKMLETPEGGVIRTGSVSYKSRNVSVRKYTSGIEFSDELIDYTPLDLIRIYFEDLGKMWGLQLDGIAISTLRSGDAADGSMSAGVIGAETAGKLTYKDILRLWVRLSQLDRQGVIMLMNENTALEFLDLPEVKDRKSGTVTFEGKPINFEIPTASDILLHYGLPDKQIMFVNKNRALIKLNAQPLTIESERIVRRQLEGRYCSLTTGFANIHRDGRLILDYSKSFTAAGFPDYLSLTQPEEV